ncbi:MAG: signal peptide peptidase SppA [Bacteroidia bacterium]|nr:signal peptide peptidase SppA [Bacteroidia bacterium]
MKTFFKVFFYTMGGIFVTSIVIGIVMVYSILGKLGSALDGGDEKEFVAKSRSVLKIDFNGQISERNGSNPFAALSGKGEGLSLDMVLMNLKKAKEDTAIKGVFMQMDAPEAGFATIEEIRNGLLDFKKSGKFIYAYGETYSQKSYYLATAADKIFLNPQGGMELKGLSAQIMFYKKALENLNVEVQIFKHGKFKSAVEPYFLDKMSPANREQTTAFIGSIWTSVLNGISKQRNISVDELNKMADELTIKDPQSALDKKLVDGLKYDDEVQEFLKEKLGIKKEDKIAFVKMNQYKKSANNLFAEKTNAGSKIAVIYAVGSIESGEGNDETIGSDRIARAIKEARLDSTVKAIVLRVNSPGGSALASDVMWREVVLAKKAKPFIVSMGDVAASGGYYIACAADRIFAQPNTITGSIGVFGIMPNAQKLFSEKLGITIDTVNTNKHSDMGTLYRGVNAEEREYVQQGVENVYRVFIGRVAEGRKMEVKDVDSIGQGRVWSGTDALTKKLVDELGGFETAIKYAASKANLKENEYALVAYPKKAKPFEKFFNNLEDNVETRVLSGKLGEQYNYIQHIKFLMNVKGVQARLPFDYIIY